MIRVLVSGATGRLGAPICAAVAADPELVLAGRVARSLGAGEGFPTLAEAIAATEADVVIDVTRPDCAEPHCLDAINAGVPMVLGTTGMTPEGAERVDAAARAAGVAVLACPNFAITAVLMMRFAAEAARILPDAAIVEEHHPGKLDAPSGTAKRTADLIEGASGARPPISSLRLPGVVANQTVVFGAEAQTLEIRNVTTGLDAFVPGALLAARRVGALAPGLHVGLETVLG